MLIGGRFELGSGFGLDFYNSGVIVWILDSKIDYVVVCWSRCLL
jgi:hypothetical protein